jgi:PAS domain S-box-containing protein
VSPYDDLPLMVWRARPDMSCEYANRAWREYTGCTADAADACAVVHAEDLGRWLDTCMRAYDARAPYEIEYRMRRADGVYRWVLERAVPRYGDMGLAGYLCICADIDRHKRAADASAGALERERRLRQATEEASHAKDRLLGSVLDGPLLAGVKVLVVEDDAKARELLLKVLRAAGAEAHAVPDPAQALAALEDWHPDVLLSDTGLPGHDGYVLLRARPAAQRALSAGYDAELAKPIEPVALLATVARLVQPAQA